MPSNFPTSLDAFTNPTSTDDLDTAGVLHDEQHANTNDAIEALEAKVGIDGSAVTTSLDYRVDALESAGSGTTHVFVRKTADESDTAGTLQNDDHLFIPLAASEVWVFECVLFVSTGAEAADIRSAFTVPTGATLRWGIVAAESGATNPVGAAATFQSINVSGTAASHNVDAALVQVATLKGIVVNGANAGNLQLQWSQVIANATATTVLTNSYLLAHKVS